MAKGIRAKSRKKWRATQRDLCEPYFDQRVQKLNQKLQDIISTPVEGNMQGSLLNDDPINEVETLEETLPPLVPKTAVVVMEAEEGNEDVAMKELKLKPGIAKKRNLKKKK